jgi:hypothetical protein
VLPKPEEHGLMEAATIAVPIPVGGLTLHRLLEHEAPGEHDFEPRLSRTQAKLRAVPELFRGSISHWLGHEQAVAASERPLCFVARLELAPGGLTRLALTEQWGIGHIDVWSHPQELLATVVDVVRERRRT